MFETLSLLTLQQYWWLIISLLGALFVFLTFVQGGETLLFTVAKNEEERRLIISNIGSLVDRKCKGVCAKWTISRYLQ